MCFNTQAVRGFACALFAAVDRVSDRLELGASRKSSSTNRGSDSSADATVDSEAEDSVAEG
jgi:hypothetical protein